MHLANNIVVVLASCLCCALFLQHRTALALPSATAASAAHGETADPAAALQPRNFNPHPYGARTTEQVVVINDNASPLATQQRQQQQQRQKQRASRTPKSAGNHVRRRQSPALFNQAPIQFPSNNNNVDELGDNGVSQQQQQRQQLLNARRAAFLSQQRPSPVASAASAPSASDYDDYDQQLVGSAAYAKKHYAFSYVVRDHESGDDFSHHQQQQRDGAVKGSYKVQLPDGRTQVVKYTADDSGYKADVSYIEDNHLSASNAVPLPQHPTQQTQSHLHQQQPVAPSPHLIAAEPIYNYYKHLQESVSHQQQQQQYHHQPQHQQQLVYAPQPAPTRPSLNYASLSGGYTIPAAAPTAAAHFAQQHRHLLPASPTPSAAYVGQQQPYEQPQLVRNVQIGTYNTGPHLQQQPTRIVFPTSPTPYQDIHVQPTPREPYASTAPFAANHALPQHRLSPKNTNIVSSPATLLAADNYNYRDYGYAQQQHQQHPHQQQQAVFFVAATQATNGHRQSYGAAGSDAGAVLLQPNQALYYKHAS